MTEENDITPEEQALFTQLVDELNAERGSEKYHLIAMLVLGQREITLKLYCN